VIMSYQTFVLFDFTINVSFLYFAFFGTLCSYNFHWYFTPINTGQSEKLKWSYKNKNLHLFIFFISLAGAVYFGFDLLNHLVWLIVTAIFTFLYSAPKLPVKPFGHLKKIAIGKTIFLAFAWTHTTSILPVIFSETEWNASLELFAVNRFFLIYPICILFDYRDRHEDIKEGIRSMITHLNERGIDLVFWGSLLVFIITNVLLYFFYISFFHSILLTIPAVILIVLYNTSKTSISDYRFYFVLDGLMMLSGLLLLLFSFK
jgi:4-hydroxybenzoate polyprenyltransferase